MVTTISKKVTGKGLARFFELRGREIVENNDVLWYSVPGRIFMSLPYQLIVDYDPADIRSMLRSTRALGVRYPSLRRPGLASGLYVCKNKSYDLQTVQQKLRSQIRRGLENCEVREVTTEEMLAQGRQLNLDTMARQGRYDAEFGDTRQWERLVKAIDGCPQVTTWGSFIGDRLAAYAIGCFEDGWLHILHRMSRLSDLDRRPNHALDFTLSRRLVTDDNLEAVCFGFMGLVSGQGLHQYKIGMGYEAMPVNSVLELHPAVAPLLASAPVVGTLKSLRRLAPKSQFVERVSTVFDGARISRTGAGCVQRAEPVELRRTS